MNTIPSTDILQQNSLQAVVHDLRTPMTIIKGYLQLLLSGCAGPMSEEQAKLIKRSVAPLEDLILMTDNLMQSMNLEKDGFALHPEVINLDTTINEIIGFYEITFSQRRISLTHVGHPSFAYVRADLFWFKRILHNLIWNAYKYTPDGGQVQIHVQPNDEGLSISIQDSGLGIPSDKLQQIFEKFKQARSSDTQLGTGLGLWICKRVMEYHGGRISVDSVPGRGSRFTLWFPPSSVH